MLTLASKTPLRCCLALVLALAGAACASSNPSLRDEQQSYRPSDYEEVYERWTRSADSYAFSQLQDVVKVTATFESPDFRRAYLTRYAHDYSLTSAERTQMRERLLSETQNQHIFYLTIASHKFRDSDLTRIEPAWRVWLIDTTTGRALAPVSIQRVAPVSMAERTYFPSYNAHRMAFRVAFPSTGATGLPTLSQSAKHITLRVTGAAGRADLRWNLR